MKYIKLFEDYKDKQYDRIVSDEEFIKAHEDLSDYEIKRIKDIISHYDSNTHDRYQKFEFKKDSFYVGPWSPISSISSKTIRCSQLTSENGDTMLLITKTDDEYYYVKFLYGSKAFANMPINTSVKMSFSSKTYYYKCDQLEGLLNLICDVIEKNNK